MSSQICVSSPLLHLQSHPRGFEKKRNAKAMVEESVATDKNHDNEDVCCCGFLKTKKEEGFFWFFQ